MSSFALTLTHKNAMNISALSPARLVPQPASIAGSDAPNFDTNGDVARAMPVHAREGAVERPYLARAIKGRINRLVHSASLQYIAALTERIYGDINAASEGKNDLGQVLAATDAVLVDVARRLSEQKW